MISEEYRRLNAQLHEDRPDYGANGHRYAEYVTFLADEVGANSILDYGCGKGTLINSLRETLPDMDVRGYDPAREAWNALPIPADVVVCGDVLEHIEPEFLDSVLGHLDRLTTKAIFLHVATRPAVKFLADGRNAHLIVQPAEWWFDKLKHLGVLMHYEANADGFMSTFLRRV